VTRTSSREDAGVESGRCLLRDIDAVLGRHGDRARIPAVGLERGGQGLVGAVAQYAGITLRHLGAT
jgi:hypothetical protein